MPVVNVVIVYFIQADEIPNAAAVDSTLYIYIYYGLGRRVNIPDYSDPTKANTKSGKTNGEYS